MAKCSVGRALPGAGALILIQRHVADSTSTVNSSSMTRAFPARPGLALLCTPMSMAVRIALGVISWSVSNATASMEVCPRYVRRTACILWVAFLVTTVCAQDSSQDELRLVLSRSLATHRATDSIQYEGTTEISFVSVNGNRSQSRTEYTYRRLGDYVDYQSRTQHSPARIRDVRHRAVFNDNYIVTYQVDVQREQLPRSGIVWEKERARERDRFFGCVNHAGTPLDGYVGTGGKRIQEYLLESRDLRRIPAGAGEAAWIGVHGTTPYGTVDLWIDPGAGHTVKRLAMRKKASDYLCLDVRVSETPIDPALRRRGLSGWRADVDQVVVEKVQGVWIPVAGTLTYAEQYVDGGESVWTRKYRRTSIEPRPNLSPRDFVTDLPPGSRVRFMDDAQSGVRYAWDGKQVVVAPAEAPAEAQGRFTARRTILKPLAAITALVLVCFLGLWIYRRAG